MEKEEVLLVVLGYGCHLSSTMRQYLDSVVVFVGINNVATIITTGGFTNRKSAPGISEACMMADYLKHRGVVVPIIMDETAITTNQNLQSVAQIVREVGFSHKKLVVFCDQARNLKVKILGRILLGHWPTTKTHPLSKGLLPKVKQLIVATPLDVLASLFPFFEKMEIRRKERIMKDS